MDDSSGDRCPLRVEDAVRGQSGRQQSPLSWGGGETATLAGPLSSGSQALLQDTPCVSLGLGCFPVTTGLCTWLSHDHLFEYPVLPVIYLSSSMNIQVEGLAPEYSTELWALPLKPLPSAPWGTDRPGSPLRSHCTHRGTGKGLDQ